MNAVHITSLRPVAYLADCHHRLQAIMVSYCCLSYGIMLLSRFFFFLLYVHRTIVFWPGGHSVRL